MPPVCVRHALIVAYVMMVIRLVMMAVNDEGKYSKVIKARDGKHGTSRPPQKKPQELLQEIQALTRRTQNALACKEKVKAALRTDSKNSLLNAALWKVDQKHDAQTR